MAIRGRAPQRFPYRPGGTRIGLAPALKGGAPYVTVRLPKDADLAAALLGSGSQHEAMLNKLASAADPSSGRAALLICADLAPAVAHDLELLAGRAAEAGHSQAGAVTALAAQIRSPAVSLMLLPLPAPRLRPPETAAASLLWLTSRTAPSRRGKVAPPET